MRTSIASSTMSRVHPILFVSLVGLAAIASPSWGQQPADRFLGNWFGTLVTAGANLRLALTVKRDSGGQLGGDLVSLDQGNARFPGTFALRGDSLVILFSQIGASYTAAVSASGDSLHGSFIQFSNYSLSMGRNPVAAAAPPKPQDPRPPFPYDTQSVSVESVAGVRLSGTLTMPRGAGPFPAVVLVTGSGAQNRDEELMGHRPFLVIADHLTRNGIAVLRYDDRGVGKSTGNFATATSNDFANDAEAAVRFLMSTPRIARNRIGVMGHSEGGLVAPIVATRSRDVAFIVLLAGTGIPGDSILLLQQALIGAANGAPESALERAGTVNRKLYAALKSAKDSADAARQVDEAIASILADLSPAERPLGEQQLKTARSQLLSPWTRNFITYDPRPTLQNVRIPVLALNGTLDLQVPSQANLSAIKAALDAGGNRNVRVVELPGLNHLFQHAKTGSPNEYSAITETFSTEALGIITDWIRGLK